MSDELNMPIEEQVAYTDDNIRHLSDMEHVRLRPGMYIGKLGDGSQNDDGIYVLMKEVVDNSIDEFKMNAGKRIEIDITDHKRVSVRDYGRGIPQGKLMEAVSVLNTGGKYDSKAFKKSVGLNGVGIKAVNALSAHFEASSYRDGKVRTVVFEKGVMVSDTTTSAGPEASSLNPTMRFLWVTRSARPTSRPCCATTPISIRASPSCSTASASCHAMVWWTCSLIT